MAKNANLRELRKRWKQRSCRRPAYTYKSVKQASSNRFSRHLNSNDAKKLTQASTNIIQSTRWSRSKGRLQSDNLQNGVSNPDLEAVLPFRTNAEHILHIHICLPSRNLHLPRVPAGPHKLLSTLKSCPSPPYINSTKKQGNHHTGRRNSSGQLQIRHTEAYSFVPQKDQELGRGVTSTNTCISSERERGTRVAAPQIGFPIQKPSYHIFGASREGLGCEETFSGDFTW